MKQLDVTFEDNVWSLVYRNVQEDKEMIQKRPVINGIYVKKQKKNKMRFMSLRKFQDLSSKGPGD